MDGVRQVELCFAKRSRLERAEKVAWGHALEEVTSPQDIRLTAMREVSHGFAWMWLGTCRGGLRLDAWFGGGSLTGEGVWWGVLLSWIDFSFGDDLIHIQTQSSPKLCSEFVRTL